MKNIKISERTLSLKANEIHTSLSFKEKVEIARLLELANTDIVEFPKIKDEKTDTLLLRTACAFLKNSVTSIEVGFTEQSIDCAFAAISGAAKPRLNISLPVSPVGMEYTLHKKAPKLIELVSALVTKAASLCTDVEFTAEDATRAESEVLKAIIEAAINAGAKTITVCDSEGSMLPDAFAEFISGLFQNIPSLKNVNLGVMCSDKQGLAAANTLMAVNNGATEIKCASIGEIANFKTVSEIIRNSGDKIGVKSELDYTKLSRIASQIENISNGGKYNESELKTEIKENELQLTSSDTIETVSEAVKKLGYDLTEDDISKVYESFKTLASRKQVSLKELDAIIASTAMQVQPTYKLISYVINSGNIITTSANIVLERDGERKEAISIGDGPVDAAFSAIAQVAGASYELDDFQIQSVTEGTEALGSAIVKLRSGGKLYSGKGLSTDIIGAAIRAYINAVNKIVFEEN